MTGFARAEGREGGAEWAWEVRSVNGKSLDVRCRVPPGYDRLDQPARAAAAARLVRGNVNMTLTMTTNRGDVGYQINRALLAQARGLAMEMGEQPPTVGELLSMRGLFEQVTEAPDPEAAEDRDGAVMATLESALDGLVAARKEEGHHLAEVLATRLAVLDDHVAAAEECAAVTPAAMRERLAKLVAELLEASPGLPEERLAQEVALVVGKADVREELDRLKAHTAAARGMLAAGEPIGRRLDFLCQELNREANTICAKSPDLTLTEAGLGMKAAVEQFREQVQNVE